MKLTNPEKLILIMLSEIYKKLGINGNSEIDPKFLTDAIYSDNTWGLDWKYAGIFSDNTEPNPPEVTEVVNYLDMWSFIESAYEGLDAASKKLLKDDPEIVQVQFTGFDGNNETEYMSVARFLINQLDRFTEFKNRELNSHYPMIGRYRRMYSIFEPIRRNLDNRKLILVELQSILKLS